MQTFLPFETFEDSAAVLDRQRLGKQRVETLQILNVLTDPTKKGWANHPAVRMWRGYEASLIEYGLVICAEWTSRGYRDSVAEKLRALTDAVSSSTNQPPWMGYESFHRSHQSNLLRKNFEFYHDEFPGVPDDLPYVWPVCNECKVPTTGPSLCREHDHPAIVKLQDAGFSRAEAKHLSFIDRMGGVKGLGIDSDLLNGPAPSGFPTDE